MGEEEICVTLCNKIPQQKNFSAYLYVCLSLFSILWLPPPPSLLPLVPPTTISSTSGSTHYHLFCICSLSSSLYWWSQLSVLWLYTLCIQLQTDFFSNFLTILLTLRIRLLSFLVTDCSSFFGPSHLYCICILLNLPFTLASRKLHFPQLVVESLFPLSSGWPSVYMERWTFLFLDFWSLRLDIRMTDNENPGDP